MASRELEELTAGFENLNWPISDSHLRIISRSYCKDWRLLSYLLGPEESITVNDIEKSSRTETEKRIDFFKHWKSIQGSRATYRSLIDALLGINRREDAERVCDLLKSDRRSAMPLPSTQQNSLPMLENVHKGK